MLEILESPVWAIDHRYVAQNASFINAMMESGNVDLALIEKRKESRPVMQIAVVGPGTDAMVSAVTMLAAASAGAGKVSGSKVAVIPLEGPVMKNGGMCSYGSKDIIAWVDKANADADVSSIVLVTDSPGGQVDGTEAMANAIKNSAKPVVAYIDGLAASAAYWAVSQASHIFISSGTTAWAGSIGSLIRHVDSSQALAQSGQKVTYITADRSTHKVLGNGTEPLTEEAIAYYKSDLNTVNDTFISAVESGRGDKLTNKEEVFSAKIYNGKQAIKLGLVDKVGTLNDAIRHAAKLSKTANLNSTGNNSKQSSMSTFPKLASLLGFGTPAAASADAEITDANASAAESALTALESRASVAEAALVAANATIATLTSEKAGLAAKVTQLEAWKKESAGVEAKTEDESNKIEAAVETELTPWEKEVAAFKKSLGVTA